MGLFRQQFTKIDRATGEKVVGKSKNWYIQFTDHTDRRRRLPAYRDKKASERLLQNIERLRDFRRNHSEPDPALMRWLESMPPKLRDRLIDFGLLEKRRRHIAQGLSDHLADFKSDTSRVSVEALGSKTSRILSRWHGRYPIRLLL